MEKTLLQQIEEEMVRLEEEMLLGDVSTQSFDLVNNTSIKDNILSPSTKVQDFGIQSKDILGKPKKYDGILTKNDNFVVSAGMFNLKRTNESESDNDQWFDIIVDGNKVGKYGLSFYNDIKAIGIGDLEIYPEYRNKGYGTKTIKDIISKYKNTADLIYCFVDKDNTDAIRLYKRLGTVSDKSNTSQKIGDYEWRNSNGQYYVEFYNRNKSLTKENYERPWSLEEIKMYVPDKYEELSKCPIHRWKAESGIELIHKEPTRDELDRIWKNWNLMPKEMQNISDKKSIELFGITNAENYRQLTSEIDESNNTANESLIHEDTKKCIFPVLKPELYNKLLETKLTEDESKEFDFKQFEDFINKLDVTDSTTRNKVINFLRNNNKDIVFIGEGDGRIAFYISEIKGISDGNPCCLKIAKNKNGIQQNKTDSKILSNNAKYNCFPKLFKYDSNGKYEITEVGKIADKKFFQKYIQNFNKIVDKMKSTIEANIKTSDYNSLKIADYEDEEDLNDPFNYKPEEIIKIVRIFKKPKERRFKYFQDDKTYLDKFLIPLCKSHPEYSTILGLIQFALSGKMNIDLGELNREQNWAIITRNNVEIPMPIDVGFLDESQEFNSDLTNLNESDIQGFENMSIDELKKLILDGIHSRMVENNIMPSEATILKMAIVGSRNRNTAKSDSDLDVVIEYSGTLREDDFFNILHSETEDGEFEINGIEVDVNPICKEKTGTLEQYLNRSQKYDEYILSNIKLNEAKKKKKKYYPYRRYGAFYPYWPIFPIRPSKPDSEQEDIPADNVNIDIGDISSGDAGCDIGGIGESEIQTNLGKILLTEATHEQAMAYMKKILKHWKTNIIEIVFTKKSTGATRKIRVHFDEDFVKNACNGGNSEIVKQIRATNKERDNMVVCEMLPNRKYQFRTIPLQNVKSLKIKDYKTWRYTKHGDTSDITLK